jgi:hypothetical protein
LLSSLVVGLSLPLISYQIQEIIKIPASIEYEETSSVPMIMNRSTPLIQNVPINKSFDWNIFLHGIYVFGIFFMFLKMFYSFVKLHKIFLTEKIHKSINLTNPNSDRKLYISTQSNYANSSFFNLIFIDDSNLSVSEINQILEHEKWHIKLFHSYDLLFVEILKIIFWFNPILWLYQRSLSEVHEYEVDTRMIQTYNPQTYAQLLLKLATSTPQLAATHQFSRKPLTDRIHFLFTKQKSVPMKRFAYLSVLPILGAFFMTFSVERVVKYQEVEESSKYFKVVRGEFLKHSYPIEVIDKKVISTLNLSKNRINLNLASLNVNKEAIKEATKYFESYGFKLELVNKSEDLKTKGFEKLEIHLFENGDNKKSRLLNKKGIRNKDAHLEIVRSKYDKKQGNIVMIVADKSTGLCTIDILMPPPPPPVPPLPPPAPPKVGFRKNLVIDSIKLVGEGELGKNPLVIINGKKYPSSVLHTLNPDKIHGTALYKKNNPQPIIKELRENNSDGALVLETKKEEELFLTGKELEISIENENRRQDVKKMKSIVSRVTLTNNKDGKKYDEVTVYREDGSKRASVNVRIGGKVLFLVKGKPKTEGELKKLNPKMLGNSVWASSGRNEYYINKFPEIGKNAVATIAFNE